MVMSCVPSVTLGGMHELAPRGHSPLQPSDTGISPTCVPATEACACSGEWQTLVYVREAEVEGGKVWSGHLEPTWPQEEELSAAGWHTSALPSLHLAGEGAGPSIQTPPHIPTERARTQAGFPWVPHGAELYPWHRLPSLWVQGEHPQQHTTPVAE